MRAKSACGGLSAMEHAVHLEEVLRKAGEAPGGI
jgi:hypothetical protein